jgi:hypothetical protein
MAGTAADVVHWLAQSGDAQPPPSCWRVLDTLIHHKASPDLVTAVLEDGYNVHGFPAVLPAAAAAAAPSHIIMSEEESENGDYTPSSPLGFEAGNDDTMVEDHQQGEGFNAIPAPHTIYKVDTVEIDDDTDTMDTSYFILEKYHATGLSPRLPPKPSLLSSSSDTLLLSSPLLSISGGSRIQWLYLPHQMETVFSPDWTAKIEAITAAGAIPAFLSDHTQTLDNPNTWTEVTDRVVWNPTPAEPAPGLIYIVGSYQDHQEVVEDDLVGWFLDRLLTIGRDGGKKLKKTFA